MKQDLINTIKESQHTIRDLRRTNEVLGAKVEVFESMMLLFTSQPNFRNQQLSPDVVYALDKHVEELEDEMRPQPAKAKIIPQESNAF